MVEVQELLRELPEDIKKIKRRLPLFVLTTVLITLFIASGFALIFLFIFTDGFDKLHLFLTNPLEYFIRYNEIFKRQDGADIDYYVSILFLVATIVTLILGALGVLQIIRRVKKYNVEDALTELNQLNTNTLSNSLIKHIGIEKYKLLLNYDFSKKTSYPNRKNSNIVWTDYDELRKKNLLCQDCLKKRIAEKIKELQQEV